MRKLQVLLVLVMVAVLGVGVIHAADLDGVPVFTDGRVNNWQMDEPVAVYCVFDYSQNVNVGVFQRVEVWGLDGNKLLQATAAQIDAAAAPATLDSEWSYTLSKVADNTFEVTAPDGYSFTWQRGDTDC